MFKTIRKYPFFLLSLTFLISLFSSPAKAVVQIDSSSSAGAFDVAGIGAPLTWSHAVGNGISRALFVGVSTSVSTIPIGPPGPRVLGVTYNGVTLDPVGSQVSPIPNNNNAIEIFRLVNPPTGTANIVVTLLPSTANYVFGGAVSFTGVDQTNPNGSFVSNSGNGSTPTVTVNDGVAGDIVFDTVSSSFNAFAFLAGAGQTVCFPTTMPETNCRRGRRFFGGLSDVGAVSTEPPTSPVTMNWTLLNPADWAIGAIAVKAFVPSAASGEISGRVLTSEGRGMPRISISLTKGNGEIITARTNPFGYFRFKDLEVGNTYILQPKGKRYLFAPNVILLDDSIRDLILHPIGK